MDYNPHGFHVRTRQALSQEQWDKVSRKPILKLTEENIEKADDWIEVYPKEQGRNKYNRHMYSPSLEQFREMTMGEFYQGSVVD